MISDKDLARRDKLLGMLSSDFEGERANASAMLAKMASHYKLSIVDLCQAGVTVPSQNQQPKPQAHTKSAYEPDSDDSMEMLMMLRKVIDHHINLVTAWEEEFLENVTRKYVRDIDLSEKQRSVAMRILTKVSLNAGRSNDGFRPV